MTSSITIDWRFVLAAGVSTVGVIFAFKMTPEDTKEVAIHAIDASDKITIVNTIQND